MTVGLATRTAMIGSAIPGLIDGAIGLKHVEEAVEIRDRLLTAFDRAAMPPAGPPRDRLLTVTFVGGGLAGVEGFAESLALATELLRCYPELDADELSFHLVEAQGRDLPEVTDLDGLPRPTGRRAPASERRPRAPGPAADLGSRWHVVLSTGDDLRPATVRTVGVAVDDQPVPACCVHVPVLPGACVDHGRRARFRARR
nr:hypothetical protein [Nakamurella leprariae]